MSAPLRVLLPLVLAAVGCGGGVQARHATAEEPSVLVVVIDGLRADRLGGRGGAPAKTPVLDALGAEGRRWVDVITPAPWSAPALAALLAGAYPSTLGMTDLEAPLAPATRTLAEILSARGYATGAVLSHPFVGARHGFDQGFAQVVEVGYPPADGQQGTQVPRTPTGGAATDAALRFLDGVRGRPYLLLVHYADPLPPWPARGVGFGDPEYRGPVVPGMDYRELLARAAAMDEADREQLAALYDGEVAATDRELGRLLAGLAQCGRDADTLVVVTSLHGFELLEHGQLGDAKTLYDELIHVPLVVRGPGVPPGVDRTAASLIDVLPTVLGWLGAGGTGSAGEGPFEGPFEGIALRPGQPPPARDLYAETDRARSLRAVISGRWKLIRDLETGGVELYDLLDDPLERLDLSDRGPVRALEAALRAWETRGDG